MHLETNLQVIADMAEKREDENYKFRTYLKGSSKNIDAIVHKLNNHISTKIDCTTCGNCCKSYMISVTQADAEKLASHLQIPAKQFIASKLSVSEREDTENEMIFSDRPCSYLTDNKCTVYSARPATCAEFPHLHKDEFVSRLYSVISNYGVCPIVYNVYEELKLELNWIYNY
jgi:uncharacterized protein